MNVLVGLAVGIFIAVVICGVAAFGAICVGVVKDYEARKESEEESKEEEEDEQ